MKKTRALLAGATLALASWAAPVRAEPPALYRTVTSVHWVVKDLEKVKAHWAALGVPSLADAGRVTVSGFRGAGTASLRAAVARFDSVAVLWLQPESGRSAYSEHLARHGEGVFSINYAADAAARDTEVARLDGIGVKVLQKAEAEVGGARQSVVYLDTAAEGKYVVGLVDGSLPPVTAPPSIPFPAKLSQYALVVKSLEAAGEYWAKLGFPAMEVTHPGLSDLRHRGQPGTFDQRLGWHRHGTITWEWIEPLRGPTVYAEFLQRHGEGFHHFAFDVPDMDAAIAAWEKLGARTVQSGAWGEKGKPGSGRFAYAETDVPGGVTIELLWNQR
jgi:catechol 2,3-dioxygenase-like lactoylglutathione lyase family enzyme